MHLCHSLMYFVVCQPLSEQERSPSYRQRQQRWRLTVLLTQSCAVLRDG